MSASNIYTRTSMGLDSRIWITFLVTGLLAAGLLGFRIATDVPCSGIEIRVEGFSTGKEDSYYLGEKITFRARMKQQKEVIWDFGDHSPVASGDAVIHEFNNEGSYLVTATVNGKCTESRTLLIRQLTAGPVTSSAATDDPIRVSDGPSAGVPVSFSSAVSGSSYEWMVLNAPDYPVQNGAVASFTFLAPGSRIIQLKLNNDPAKVYRKTIQVLPSASSGLAAPIQAPPPMAMPLPMPVHSEKEGVPAEAEAPKVLILPDEEFKSMLNQATEGSKEAQSFYQYLCFGAKTKVLVNGEDWKSFGELYEQIHGKKRYDVKSVQTERDEKNCVTIMKVRLKKRGILGM